MSERPLSDFKILTDDGQELDDDNSLFQTWCILLDMADIERRVLNTWDSYAKGEITLITASFLTTQAEEIVREMDAEYARDMALGTAYTDYRHILTKTLDLSSDIPHMALLSELQRHGFAPYTELILSPTWQFISAYTISAEPGVGRLSKGGYFVDCVPENNRDKMTAEHRHEEDRGLIATHMAEVHLAVMASQLSSSLKPHLVKEVSTSGKSPDEASLGGGMRYLLAHCRKNGGDGRIPTHIVFEWNAWKEIVHINRQNPRKAFEEYRGICRSVMSSAQDFLRGFPGSDFYTLETIQGIPEAIRASLVDFVNDMLLQDPITRMKKQTWPQEAPFTPHASYLRNPWAWGASAIRLLGQAHHIGVQLMNGSAYLSASLQLYKRVGPHGQVSALEDDGLFARHLWSEDMGRPEAAC